MRIDLKFNDETIDILSSYLKLKYNDYFWNGTNIKELSDEHMHNIINYVYNSIDDEDDEPDDPWALENGYF